MNVPAHLFPLALATTLVTAPSRATEPPPLSAERGDTVTETRFTDGDLAGRVAEVRYTLPGRDGFSAVEIRRTRLEADAGGQPLLRVESAMGGPRTIAVGPLVAGAAQVNLVDRDGDGRIDSLAWRAPADDGVVETVDYDVDGQPDVRRTIHDGRVDTAIWLRAGWHALRGEGATRHVLIDGARIAVTSDGRGRFRESDGGAE
ncbi:MAG: hypothetical protein AB7Q81_10780 [Gammaproteobacteria bacterium]